MNLCILKQQRSEIIKSAFAIGTDNFCLEVIRGHEISVSHIFFGPMAYPCGLVIYFTYYPIAQCPKYMYRQLVLSTVGLRLTPLTLETTLKVSDNLKQPQGLMSQEIHSQAQTSIQTSFIQKLLCFLHLKVLRRQHLVCDIFEKKSKL